MTDVAFPAPLFLAHGSPMLALEGGAWGAALGDFGARAAEPRAYLVCSAHWEAPGPFRVTSAQTPGILHDFGGFPEALYALDYPAPGAPELAEKAVACLRAAGLSAEPDSRRPLDHGAWVPLRYLAPSARVPVLQVSLPRPRTPELLMAAGRALIPLLQEGVQLLGSGGIVHNLGQLDWTGNDGPRPWASAFQAWVDSGLRAETPEILTDWKEAPGAALAVPTSEHLDPLFLVLGAAGRAAEPLFEGWQLGSLSLASYRF